MKKITKYIVCPHCRGERYTPERVEFQQGFLGCTAPPAYIVRSGCMVCFRKGYLEVTER